MTKLLRRVPNLLGTCDIPIANAKHHIKFTKEKRDRFYQAARDSSELLVAALRERMPDSPIIFSLLKMFDARQLPEGVLPADYGNEDVETVLEHFAPKAKAAEAKTSADAEPSNDELQAAAKEASARAAKVSVDDYVDADKLRAEWVRFKFSFLKHQRGSDYRKLYKFLVTATDPSTIEMMMKLGGVLVIIALGNAISERGFSLMNHIKTKKKASLDKGLDPKMRVVCLGPTDEAGITKLVDEATVTVFGRASPGRSQGAAVANDVRRAKKAKKDEAAAGSSSATIKAEGNAKVTRGGSTTQKLSSATFPREYRADVPMPPLDKSLKGKDVFYLIDDNTGSGYKFHRYTVAKAKKPSRVGADGNDLAGVKFRFALQKGKKGESFKTCLPAEQYGTKKKWYMAVKK